MDARPICFEGSRRFDVVVLAFLKKGGRITLTTKAKKKNFDDGSSVEAAIIRRQRQGRCLEASSPCRHCCCRLPVLLRPMRPLLQRSPPRPAPGPSRCWASPARSSRSRPSPASRPRRRAGRRGLGAGLAGRILRHQGADPRGRREDAQGWAVRHGHQQERYGGEEKIWN